MGTVQTDKDISGTTESPVSHVMFSRRGLDFAFQSHFAVNAQLTG